MRPSVGSVGFGAGNRKRLRHIDVEFMRRRELAVGVTGAAAVAEIGEIIEVAVGKRSAHLHRRKYRAEAFAIAAGISDPPQPAPLPLHLSSLPFSPPPLPPSPPTPP